LGCYLLVSCWLVALFASMLFVAGLVTLLVAGLLPCCLLLACCWLIALLFIAGLLPYCLLLACFLVPFLVC
jgi:hypothetical protein